MACLTAVAVGDAKARAEDDLTQARDALAVVEEDGHRLQAEVTRLAVEGTSLCQSLRQLNMRCLLLIPRRARIRKPWKKITRKLWSRFSLMATDVACSNTASMVTSQGFWIACLTLSTHFLQSFF